MTHELDPGLRILADGAVVAAERRRAEREHAAHVKGGKVHGKVAPEWQAKYGKLPVGDPLATRAAGVRKSADRAKMPGGKPRDGGQR